MKKFLLLMMMLFSMIIFANNSAEKITNKINFGITPKQLQSVVKSNPLPNSHDNGEYAVYYYENVADPLGIERHLNSFAFEQNSLFSAIFDSQTTDKEHKEIIDLYTKNINKLFKGKVVKEINSNEVIFYDNSKLIKINRIIDHTFITVRNLNKN